MYSNEQIIPGQYPQCFLCPFDHTDSIAATVCLEPQIGNLLHVIQAVKIKVVQGKSAMILSEDNKRRTECMFFDPETACDALNQTGLAGSQLTYEKEYVRFLSQVPQVASQELSLLRAA